MRTSSPSTFRISSSSFVIDLSFEFSSSNFPPRVTQAPSHARLYGFPFGTAEGFLCFYSNAS